MESQKLAIDMVAKARKSFSNGTTKPYEFRLKQLEAMVTLLEENVDELVSALHTDLRKSKQEAVVTEVNIVMADVRNTILNLKEWMTPVKTSRELIHILDDIRIYHDPYGVVLIMGTWNYPIQLTLLPFSAAIAAGNTVILKPSELAVECAKLLKKLIPKYLDNSCYFVYLGDVEETRPLLEQKFDYIFFTGSPAVGRIIHKAANKHLTPVTLELGGKSPIFIDDTCNMKIAAKRILWGKLINSGQTCIAPDYMLCTKQVEEKFLEAAKVILTEWYGSDAKKSPDLCRIINADHFRRLLDLLKSGKIVLGGHSDEMERYIEPTIVVDVKVDDKIMQEEIFGPILPIFNVNSLQEAVEFINNREKPLALYIFSQRKDDVKMMIDNTSSGGITVNDTIMHMTVTTLPFGGVGNSGMGSYHGKFSFETFTHKKGCIFMNVGPIGDKLFRMRYPPYSDQKVKFLTWLAAVRLPNYLRYFHHVLVFSLGIICALLFKLIFCDN